MNNAIKSLLKIEDRTASPVVYSNGEININGGTRALRFYDGANGTSALLRPLGGALGTESTVYFSFLFRCNNASPLANQDFFQLGFDVDAATSGGNPRVSVGANTTVTTFPPNQPFQFFARTTAAVANSAFDNFTDIQSAVTYFLVGRISGLLGAFDRVDLFVNPASLAEPGTPSASFTLDSGVASLSHFYIRTSALDSGDAYVVDELRVGRDFGSVVPEPGVATLACFGFLGFCLRRRVRRD